MDWTEGVTREQFLAAIKRNRMPVVFRGDDGVWHGQDFLLPGCNDRGNAGCKLEDLPPDAKHCQNPYCDCYVYMSPEAHAQEYGW